jgi:hypothetical protein
MAKGANFKVDPKLAHLLGEGYRTTEQALKELVDNAWDAEAENIWITLPKAMTSDPVIVRDDGSGMTELEVRNEYLKIASDRRSRKGDRTPNLRRLVKGRKGIGKFSGLMVAGVMELETVAREKFTKVIISKADLEAVHNEFGVGAERNRAVASEIEAVRWRPVRAGVVQVVLDVDQIGQPAVVVGHTLERFPIDAFFINAQAAPARFVAENLIGKLINAGTGFTRTGITGDEPATAKLIALPTQAFERGNRKDWLFSNNQREKSDRQKCRGDYLGVFCRKPVDGRTSGNQVRDEK